jgi:hypothetical protein
MVDVYGASRDELSRLVLRQREQLADLEQQVGRLRAAITTLLPGSVAPGGARTSRSRAPGSRSLSPAGSARRPGRRHAIMRVVAARRRSDDEGRGGMRPTVSLLAAAALLIGAALAVARVGAPGRLAPGVLPAPGQPPPSFILVLAAPPEPLLTAGAVEGLSRRRPAISRGEGEAIRSAGR